MNALSGAISRWLDRFRPARHLQFRLGFVLGAVAFLLAFGQAMIERHSVHRSLLNESSQEIADVAIRTAGVLGRAARDLRDSLGTATVFAIGSRTLRYPSPREAAQFKEILESLRADTPNVAWLGLVTVKGELIAETTDLPARDGKAPEPSKQTIGLSIPIERNGRIEAMLRIRLHSQFAREAEQTALPQSGPGSSYQFLIIASTGQVLYGPAGTLGQTAPLDSLRHEGAVQLTNRIVHWPDGRDYLSALVPAVGHRGALFPEWQVVVRKPGEEVLRPATAIERTRIATAAVLALFFAMLGWALARHLVSPLRRMSVAAAAWRNGEADISMPVIERADEIGELSRSLAALVRNMTAQSEALRISEGRFREIFEASPVSLWVLDFSTLKRTLDALHKEGVEDIAHYLDRNPDFLVQALRQVRVLDVNRSTLRIMQSGVRDSMTRTLDTVFGADSHDLFQQQVMAIADGATHFEGFGKLRTRTGELRFVQCSFAVPGTPPDYQRVLVAYADVTDRTRIERELRASEERFRLLVDGVRDYSIIMLDADGRIVSWNAGAERIKGYTAHEVIGQPLSLFYTTEDMVAGKAAQMLDAARQHGSATDEGWRVRKDGSRFLANVVITSLRDESGGLHGYSKVTRDVTELRLAAQRIEHLATRDPLTNLPNRLLLQDRLEQTLAVARRAQTKMALMFVDLDRFKYVNDTLGHHIGDVLLREASARLTSALRQGDTVARQGGDEFILLLPSLQLNEDAEKVANKVLAALAQPFIIQGQSVSISGSVGIAMYPADGEDSSTLLRNADIAMYDAKAAGANTFRFFAAQMSSKTLRRTLVEQGLHAAVDKGEIEVHFQPQVRLSDFEVVGFEALARWSHPKLGEVAPMEFISIAEEIGLIHALGEQILYKACRHAAQWPKLGLPPVRVAVNVSPKQLSNPSFPDVISKVLRECGLQPERLELEITESVAIEFASGSADAIQAIAALGVKLAIDDFGAGYSGLSYLKQLPIDTIKIDRTFVRDAPGERDDVVIIRAVIALARSLGVQVCAEGVERSEQVAFLTHAECDYAQGFYFGEAGPAKDISAVVNMLDSANVVPFRKNLKVGT